MSLNKINKTEVVISDQTGWSKVTKKDYYYFYTGCKSFVDKFTKEYLLKKRNENDTLEYLKKFNSNSSLIFKGRDLLFCYTSFSRDYPIFYKPIGNKLVVSDNVYSINENSDSIYKDGLNEFLFSGYVLNNRTLNENIFSLEPSQIIYVKKNNEITIKNYFRYHELKKKQQSLNQFFFEFNEIIDNSIEKIIDESNEAKIYIPLSGGLDSRFLLAKFCEKKYKNIECFSYGLSNNSDAVIAKKVANHLGINWSYVWFEKKKYRKMFNSKFKEDYDKFSDHFSTLPNYQEIFFLKDLNEKKYFKENSFIINGQSADFHTGLHIPENLYLIDIDREKKIDNKEVIATIIDKHLSLWPNEKSKENYKHLTNKIFSGLADLNDIYNLSDIYEYWEFKERQCKYIVNGQRAYDFMNIKWFLPFWDSEYIKFWSTVPLELRYKQSLYKKILKKWDYCGLFTKINKEVQAFEGVEDILVKSISKITKILFGKTNSQEIIKYFDYYSRYGNSYQLFSLSIFLLNRHRINNAFSLHTKHWLNSNEKIREQFS